MSKGRRGGVVMVVGDGEEGKGRKEEHGGGGKGKDDGED